MTRWITWSLVATSTSMLFRSLVRIRVRRYVIENCKDQEKIESIKKEKKIRMNRW